MQIPYKYQQAISTTEIFPLWPPFFGKEKFYAGAGRCMLSFPQPCKDALTSGFPPSYLGLVEEVKQGSCLLEGHVLQGEHHSDSVHENLIIGCVLFHLHVITIEVFLLTVCLFY